MPALVWKLGVDRFGIPLDISFQLILRPHIIRSLGTIVQMQTLSARTSFATPWTDPLSILSSKCGSRTLQSCSSSGRRDRSHYWNITARSCARLTCAANARASISPSFARCRPSKNGSRHNRSGRLRRRRRSLYELSRRRRSSVCPQSSKYPRNDFDFARAVTSNRKGGIASCSGGFSSVSFPNFF